MRVEQIGNKGVTRPPEKAPAKSRHLHAISEHDYVNGRDAEAAVCNLEGGFTENVRSKQNMSVHLSCKEKDASEISGRGGCIPKNVRLEGRRQQRVIFLDIAKRKYQQRRASLLGSILIVQKITVKNMENAIVAKR